MQWVEVMVNDFRSKCANGRRHYDTDDDWGVPGRDYSFDRDAFDDEE